MTIVRRSLKVLLFAASLPLMSCGARSTSRGQSQPTDEFPIVWQPGNWTVAWQDEFEGMAGTAPDPTKWTHEIGGDGWGNKELQYYTDGTDNVSLDGSGNLAITARKEAFMGNAFTSARLTTEGLFSQAYGKFEARMQLVRGVGMWPAFWIMGDNIDAAGWPGAGEVDIMEQRGYQLRQVWGSLHGPDGADKDLPSTYPATLPDDVDTNFHVYAIEWEPDVVTFLVDDQPYAQVMRAHLPAGGIWVWDHPFFVIVNLAVGGVFGGDPNDLTPMPQSLLIDYVRVSTKQP
jgi:beta-glucanase (GH16 family)